MMPPRNVQAAPGSAEKQRKDGLDTQQVFYGTFAFIFGLHGVPITILAVRDGNGSYIAFGIVLLVLTVLCGVGTIRAIRALRRLKSD